jgi:hypothetical protein
MNDCAVQTRSSGHPARLRYPVCQVTSKLKQDSDFADPLLSLCELLRPEMTTRSVHCMVCARRACPSKVEEGQLICSQQFVASHDPMTSCVITCILRKDFFFFDLWHPRCVSNHGI